MLWRIAVSTQPLVRLSCVGMRHGLWKAHAGVPIKKTALRRFALIWIWLGRGLSNYGGCKIVKGRECLTSFVLGSITSETGLRRS